MENDWFECAKLAAYYLWEHSGCENALNLWHAAEDIASFFEQANILDAGMVASIKKLGIGSEGYTWFVRNLAFRLHIYTKNPNELDNWYLAEGVLNSPVLIQNLTTMATLLKTNHDSTVKHLRSDLVRSYYDKIQTL